MKIVKQADIKKEKEGGEGGGSSSSSSSATGTVAKKKTKRDLKTDELDSIGLADDAVDPISVFEDG